MADGTEKCTECKKSPFPQGYEPTLKLCWYCANPRGPIQLSDAQRELVELSWEK